MQRQVNVLGRHSGERVNSGDAYSVCELVPLCLDGVTCAGLQNAPPNHCRTLCGRIPTRRIVGNHPDNKPRTKRRSQRSSAVEREAGERRGALRQDSQTQAGRDERARGPNQVHSEEERDDSYCRQRRGQCNSRGPCPRHDAERSAAGTAAQARVVHATTGTARSAGAAAARTAATHTAATAASCAAATRAAPGARMADGAPATARSRNHSAGREPADAARGRDRWSRAGCIAARCWGDGGRASDACSVVAGGMCAGQRVGDGMNGV
jgi:hypothetical protein